MPTATVHGVSLAYDVIGEGRPWVLTPGARDARGTPGLRELAERLAVGGNRVLIWDRPNTGESDVCFGGTSESAVQADALAGLVQHLDMAPAVIAGGSGGSRVSLLAAARHPGLAAGVAVWWISGGVLGLMALGTYYCEPSIRAAWHGGMEAVAALDQWQEVIAANPANRDRILAQDRDAFIATMERWMAAYCPCGHEVVPGLPDEQARALEVPALVFRSGASDLSHRRETSERVAALLPNARLVEPPWGDAEWRQRQAARTSGEAPGLFVRWPLLAEPLLEWAGEVLG
jgi:pimeloyl-ACP methyl ester carboxylesterase